MIDETLEGKKLEVYVLLKILKYCTGSSARSYQCKFAVSNLFGTRDIANMEEVGSAIKEVIYYQTIRGKFSSVHPDLAAEGFTRVEVGEEGLHFIKNIPGESLQHKKDTIFWFQKKLFRKAGSGNTASPSESGR